MRTYVDKGEIKMTKNTSHSLCFFKVNILSVTLSAEPSEKSYRECQVAPRLLPHLVLHLVRVIPPAAEVDLRCVETQELDWKEREAPEEIICLHLSCSLKPQRISTGVKLGVPRTKDANQNILQGSFSASYRAMLGCSS